ncbi:MAG: prepilin-type N-terminal cleavage/methylation domain-containing protein [Verrucomicrobiota bacterium]
MTTSSSWLARDARKGGLTLIELLVVLSVIAVLSTAALRSVVGTVDQQNYDTNVEQLEEIEKAILGDGDTAGFLSDLGRLPEVRDGSPVEDQLEELLDPTIWDADELFGVSSPDGDPDVQLATGWRGPYIDLGINQDELDDAFANPYQLLQADRSPIDASDDDENDIAIIESFGADGADGGTIFSEDVEIVFEDTTTGQNFWRTILTVNVSPPEGETLIERDNPATTESIVVRIYGANPDFDPSDPTSQKLHTIEQVEEEISNTGDSSFSFLLDGDDDPTNDPDLNPGPGLPIGPKALRIYRVESVPADKQDAIADSELQSKSPITYFNLSQFNTSETLFID